MLRYFPFCLFLFKNSLRRNIKKKSIAPPKLFFTFFEIVIDFSIGPDYKEEHTDPIVHLEWTFIFDLWFFFFFVFVNLFSTLYKKNPIQFWWQDFLYFIFLFDIVPEKKKTICQTCTNLIYHRTPSIKSLVLDVWLHCENSISPQISSVRWKAYIHYTNWGF